MAEGIRRPAAGADEKARSDSAREQRARESDSVLAPLPADAPLLVARSKQRGWPRAHSAAALLGLQRTLGNQAIQRLIERAALVPDLPPHPSRQGAAAVGGAAGLPVQRAVARAATGRPTVTEPHVYVPQTGQASLSFTQGDIVAVGVSGKKGGALTAKLLVGSDYISIGSSEDAVDQQEVQLTQPTGHEQNLFKLFVRGVAATGSDTHQHPATITVFENQQPVEIISVHVWTKISLSAVPWLATVTWNATQGKPQVSGKDFTTGPVMQDATAYLAPAGIGLDVAGERALSLDVDAEISRLETRPTTKRAQLDAGIIGALRNDSTFQSAMKEKEAIHIVFVPAFTTLGYAYPMHMRDSKNLEGVNANWILNLSEGRGLERAVIIAVEAEYDKKEEDTRVARGGEGADEGYLKSEIGVDVAHEIGHKLSLPHLPVGSATIAMPFQVPSPQQVKQASLVQNLMWEHNPVKLEKKQGQTGQDEPSKEQLTNASEWLPQTASKKSGQVLHTVRGGALSPEQVRYMREALTSHRVWDVKIELAEVAKALNTVRSECEKILKESRSTSLLGPVQVKNRLRREGAPNYMKDVVLTRIGSAMQEANGAFDLLKVLKEAVVADKNWKLFLDEFGHQPPLSDIEPFSY